MVSMATAMVIGSVLTAATTVYSARASAKSAKQARNQRSAELEAQKAADAKEKAARETADQAAKAEEERAKRARLLGGYRSLDQPHTGMLDPVGGSDTEQTRFGL